MVLVKRDRINLLSSVIVNYLELVYKTASVKMIEVSTAFPFTTLQKLNLINNAAELQDIFDYILDRFLMILSKYLVIIV